MSWSRSNDIPDLKNRHGEKFISMPVFQLFPKCLFWDIDFSECQPTVWRTGEFKENWQCLVVAVDENLAVVPWNEDGIMSIFIWEVFFNILSGKLIIIFFVRNRYENLRQASQWKTHECQGHAFHLMISLIGQEWSSFFWVSVTLKFLCLWQVIVVVL